jgi:hypothetical protein
MEIDNVWLRYGLIYAGVSIILQLFTYYVYPLGLWLQSGLGLAVMIFIMVVAGKEERNVNVGLLSYGGAFKTTFLTGFIGTAIAGLFSIILIQLIDPSLIDKLTQMALDSSRSMMESMGMSEDKVAEAMDAAESGMADSFTPLKQLLNILWAAIFVAIIAAIVSIFIKKEEKII